MTIDLDFYFEGQIMLSINMCRVNFSNKVCDRISNEELDDECIIDKETEDEIYTNKVVVKKIWNGCFKHGYIKQTYDVWPDRLIVHY